MRFETIAKTEIKTSVDKEWEEITIEGVDFKTKLHYKIADKRFYDCYYNIIPRSKVQSAYFDVVRIKIYGTNSLKPYRLTVARFDDGQYTANYSL